MNNNTQNPSSAKLGVGTHAALVSGYQDAAFIAASVASISQSVAPILLTDRGDLLASCDIALRIGRPEINMFDDTTRAEDLLEALNPALKKFPDSPVLIDMSLSPDTLDDTSLLRIWIQMIAMLADHVPCGVIALYDRSALIENQMQPLLRAHPVFLSPSGLYDNPFWLPPHLHGGTIDEQMSYFLGRIVPEYADEGFFDEYGRAFARGYEPGWLSTPPRIDLFQEEGARWHVRCLGQLRLYRDGELLDWNQPGGSANKTRTLFAYLLMAGEKGVHVDQISELLWQTGDKSDVKRNRLHHSIAMLRKVLRSKSMVLRSGEYYQLMIARGTWTDVSAFEQNCRRGLFLAKEGQENDALRIYQSAEKLYQGDLFDDLPIQYTQPDFDDWCTYRRRWLRDMRVKLLRDMSVCLRSMGQPAEALQMCEKALHIDPLSEDVTTEAMRVYHSQARYDAIIRLFRQYEETVGPDAVSEQCRRVYKSLIK